MEITTAWIFGGIVTVVGSIIGWSLKELYSRFKQDKLDTTNQIEQLKVNTVREIEAIKKENARQIEQLKADIKSENSDTRSCIAEMKKEFENYKERLPEKYALKDDFNREINKLDRKIDTLKEDIQDLNKNVSALIATINNKIG